MELDLDAIARERLEGIVLKNEQKEAIYSLLRGKDVFAVLPTGFGKSLIYQLFLAAKAKLIQQSETETAEEPRQLILVISPLKSIIQDQIKCSEFCLKSVELDLETATLDSIRSGKYEVIYASAEQVLHDKFLSILKDREGFKISLLVVDEAHTVYTWGQESKKGKNLNGPFREQYGNLSTLRSFCSGVPVLALTGTADRNIIAKVKSLLSMNKDACDIVISPERPNIRLTTIQVKRENYYGNFRWLADMIKEKGSEMPKTIIFCNTMTDVAAMVGNLFVMLGKAAYVSGLPELPQNRLIGIFHSLTLPKYKSRVMDYFKENNGTVRVVIATSALSMGVNFPDVKYVVHCGPARSLVDHIQEAGRAGRNGEKSHDITIYHGNQLAQCEKNIKDFARGKSCLRKLLYQKFDSNVRSIEPHHDCCSVCDSHCKCGNGRCSRPTLPFEKTDEIATETSFEREVCDEDKQALREALLELKQQYDLKELAVFDRVGSHGFSEQMIDAVVEACAHICTLDFLMSSFSIYSHHHAIAILETVNEVFEDIPGIDELMLINESSSTAVPDIFLPLSDICHYFDKPDEVDYEDEDQVNADELENL